MWRDRSAPLLCALLLGCGFGTSGAGGSAGLGPGAESTGSTTGSATSDTSSTGQADGDQGGTADGGVTGMMTDDDDDDDDANTTGSMNDTGGTGDTGPSASSSDGMMDSDDDDDDDAADPYGPCPTGTSLECDAAQSCIGGGILPGSACGNTCVEGGEACPTPDGGTATPVCSPLGMCILDCSDGETCPGMMQCFDVDVFALCGHF